MIFALDSKEGFKYSPLLKLKKKSNYVIPGSKNSSYSVHLHADKNMQCDFVCFSISKSLTRLLIKSGSGETVSILKLKYYNKG